MLSLLGIVFFITVILGVPIAICLGLASLVYALFAGNIPLAVIPQRMFTGVDSFVLMAIPFFIMAGELMSASGLVDDLIAFAESLVGRLRGGIAHVNIIASMIFAGVSGSAVADASALGSALIPPMKREYDVDFAAGVCSSAAAIGPIIPPSIPMIVYALVGNVSVAGLFMAGVIPGLLIGFGLMGIASVIATRRKYPMRGTEFSFGHTLRRARQSAFALFLPLLILGGILGGIFTPTEAGAVGGLYALAVGIFVTKKFTWVRLYEVTIRTGIISAVVMFLIATSNVVSWILTSNQVALSLAAFLKSVSPKPAVFLLLMNLLLLVVGMLLDLTPAMIMLVPILAPIAMTYGIDPLHFGFVVVLNLVIGLLTPPVGSVLYVVVGISEISLERVFRAMLPFLMWEIIVLFAVTYVPFLCLWLPRLLGY